MRVLPVCVGRMMGGPHLAAVLCAMAVGLSYAAPLVPAPRPRPSSLPAARLGARWPNATDSDAC